MQNNGIRARKLLFFEYFVGCKIFPYTNLRITRELFNLSVIKDLFKEDTHNKNIFLLVPSTMILFNLSVSDFCK